VETFTKTARIRVGGVPENKIMIDKKEKLESIRFEGLWGRRMTYDENGSRENRYSGVGKTGENEIASLKGKETPHKEKNKVGRSKKRVRIVLKKPGGD